MSLIEELRSKVSRDNRDLLDRAADRIEELEDICKQSEGEWGFDGMSWTCSECGEYATKGIKTDFCPYCGAHMKGGAE
jgi:rubrerythrin